MFQLHCLHNHKKMYEEIHLNVNTKYEYGQNHETSLCSSTDTFWIFWSIFPKTTKGYRTERLSCPANYAENIECPMHGPQTISHK